MTLRVDQIGSTPTLGNHAADHVATNTQVNANTAAIAANTSAIALKAPLSSPAFTNVPTAPTAALTTNTTQLATTAFVLANGGTNPKRTARFIVAPYGDTRPADYTCASATGNQTEINQAITAAAALTDGGVVDLLDGEYTITGAIVPLSYVWLRGAGMFNTRIKTTTALTTGMIDNKSTYSTGSPWLGGILSDMELDGSGMNQTTEKKGINSDSLNNCKIMRMYVHDTTATGIGPDDFYGSTITECIVVSCGYMNKKTITAASWLASVITFTSASHGYSPGNVIVVTGMIPATYNGRYTISTTPTANTFTVTSSFLNLDPGTATTFGLSSDSLIGHNGIGIASGANTHEATIVTNNICINNQNNNFLIEADTTFTDKNASYIFSNNISVSAGQVGFLNTGTPNVQFVNNYDFGSQYGAQVAAVTQVRTITAAVWSGGVATFTTSADHSYAIGSKVDIYGMTPTGYNGYYTVDSVPTTTTFTVAITSNPGASTVFGTSTRVAHETDDTLIENNIFSDNVLYGVRVTSRSDKYKISGNTIKRSYNYGVSAGASDGNVTDNFIYLNGRDGVDIETGSGTYQPLSKVSVIGNHIYNNGTRATYDGIEIQSGNVTAPITDLLISGNQIYDNQETKTQRYGIIIRSGGTIADITVLNNNLKGNATAGILLQNTTDTISVVNNAGVNPVYKSELGNVTGSTTFDAAAANYFTATLTGNITAVMPAVTVKGTIMSWILTQDGTGGRTLSLPANATASGTGVGLVLSTDPSVSDQITWIYDGTKWREMSRRLATTFLNVREGITTTGPAAANKVPLIVTQSDTTNNPDAQTLTNTASGHGLQIVQNGVLGSNKYGLYVQSNAVQTAAPLARIRQTNASATQAALQLDSAGSGPALNIASGGFKYGSSTTSGYVLTADSSGNGTWQAAAAGGSGITRSIVSITSSTTLGATALTDYVALVGASGAPTMPTAVGNTNRYTIKNVHSTNKTVAFTGAETGDGSSTLTLTPNTSVDLISDNTGWRIV